MAPQISGIPNFESFVVAGKTFSDRAELIISAARCLATKVTTCVKNSGTASHQVAASKTFKVRAIIVTVYTPGAALEALLFGYGDTDVGKNAAAGPTNPVYYGDNYSGNTTPVNATGKFEIPVKFDIPAGKYPFVTGSATAVYDCKMVGYEE